MDRPLRERGRVLDELLAEKNLKHRGHRGTQVKPCRGNWRSGMRDETVIASVLRAPMFRAASPEELEELFSAAQERGMKG